MGATKAPAWLLCAAVSLGGCAHLASTREAPYVAEQLRQRALARAQVWTPVDVASKDLTIGPAGPGAFPPDTTVTCRYRPKQMGGTTPKFACVLPPNDELKVKYGRHNGEVYAEVAAARLLWALGFGAEGMYPVRVVCQDCPPSIVHDTDVASIQRKMAGTDLDTATQIGWSWSELDLVDPGAGGAPRAQRDALKLLAAFIQHTDSKPEQQRLICLPSSPEPEREPSTDVTPVAQDPTRAVGKTAKVHGKTRAHTKQAQRASGVCAESFMLLHDLGQTFGHATMFNRSNVSSVNLREWARAPVWQDPRHCIAYLPKSHTGTLNNPHISEDGRQFLATLLSQLTDAQLHDLFAVARFPERWDRADHPENAATVDQWVNAFKVKRDAVVQQQCVSG